MIVLAFVAGSPSSHLTGFPLPSWLVYVWLVLFVLVNVGLYFLSSAMERHADKVYKDGFAAYDAAIAEYKDAQTRYEEAVTLMREAGQLSEQTVALLRRCRCGGSRPS